MVHPSKILAISPNSNYRAQVNLTGILQAAPVTPFNQMPAQQRRKQTEAG
jgi:hypothetical protein